MYIYIYICIYIYIYTYIYIYIERERYTYCFGGLLVVRVHGQLPKLYEGRLAVLRIRGGPTVCVTEGVTPAAFQGRSALQSSSHVQSPLFWYDQKSCRKHLSLFQPHKS